MIRLKSYIPSSLFTSSITGYKDKDQILDAMAEKFPNARFVLTLGSDGAVYYDGKEKIFQDIFKVKTDKSCPDHRCSAYHQMEMDS